MADRQILLPQPVVNGHGFGRNILHDPRSLAFRVGRTAAPKTVFHDIYIPVLNQRNIGKCVAETGAEYLATPQFWGLLSPELKQTLSTSVDTAEDWTLDLYRELTRNDPFPGFFEPDDTGSNGLTLGKILQRRKLINGYRHATSVPEAEAVIQDSPFAIGTIFLSGMETPRPDGTVKVSGTPLGGHEYLCFGRDAERDLWWFRNHWTREWGKDGTFAYDTAGLQLLMDQQGDITVFVPLTEPKPEPTPIPEPAQPPVTPEVSQPDWSQVEPFLAHPRAWTKATKAANEIKRWRTSLPPV